jgi:hypothetical protein
MQPMCIFDREDVVVITTTLSCASPALEGLWP